MVNGEEVDADQEKSHKLDILSEMNKNDGQRIIEIIKHFCLGIEKAKFWHSLNQDYKTKRNWQLENRKRNRDIYLYWCKM